MLALEQPGDDAAAAYVWVLGDRSRFRPEVHQAVGMTMVHLGVGPREAFTRLCAHAYATDTPLAAVASEILTKRLRLELD
jgi:AmiR/NasT family two-component response regulator